MLRAFLALLLAATPLMAQIATFDDLYLPPPTSSPIGSYVTNTPFTSGGVSFNNSFTQYTGYYTWSGFSYSNAKNVTTPGVDSNGNVVNQYSAYVLPLPADPIGAGANGSANYAVAYDGSAGGGGVSPIITLPANTRPTSIKITNTTYAALSMLNGDTFSYPYTTGDYLKLTITGLNANGAAIPNNSIDFYLADYRNINGAPSYIISQWTTVDLSSLSDATRELVFSFASSEVSYYSGVAYIDTPTYFAADDFVYSTVVPEPAWLGVLLLFGAGAHAWVRRR